MKSIRQIEGGGSVGAGLERQPVRLPDWRNLGILLKVLLGANLLALAGALVQSPDLAGWLPRFVQAAAWLEMPLFMLLLVLALFRNLLWRLPLRGGQALVVAMAGLAGALQFDLWRWLGLLDPVPGGGARVVLLGALLAVVLLLYLELLVRGRSPAVVEARLLALNARIRPHFLFNSLNAVLSLIRAEPRRAETALETLSDLFRAALRDPREWLPLSEEIALCRQYLDMEKLRLGDRLQVEWQIDDVPLELGMPPLMLQPLLENAVYHGVEPAEAGGRIGIAFARRDQSLCITIDNPVHPVAGHAGGHHMALANIRERLALYYDLEARLEIEAGPSDYRVRITLPCRKPNRPSRS